MGWGKTPWSVGPWGAEEIPNTLPPGWTPAPDGGAFTYLLRSGVGAWGFRSWAGAMAVPTYPGGGITATPDAAAGVMRLRTWWPDAPILQLVRISADGSRSPVRGAYGLTVTGSTRRNVCTNPSLESSLVGYTGINANTTLASSSTMPYVTSGTAALRMVSTTTTTGANIPGTLGTGQWTIALDLGLASTVTSVTVSVAWLTSTGASAGTTNLTLTADQIAAAVAQPYRAKWHVTAPGTASTGTVSLTVVGLTIGQYAYLDSVVIEAGSTTGSYFDGTAFGSMWSGTAHLSASVLAPVQDVVDGECPLDVPVTYEVYNPALVGGSMSTPTVTLDSGRRVWLTHPSAPGEPIEVLITTTPDPVYDLEQAVMPILDSPYPVVVSSGVRQAPTSEIEIIVESFADRDRYLYATFGDGTPVLRRAPAAMGYGEGEWIVLGSISERASDGSPFDPVRTLTAVCRVVEAPESVS